MILLYFHESAEITDFVPIFLKTVSGKYLMERVIGKINIFN